MDALAGGALPGALQARGFAVVERFVAPRLLARVRSRLRSLDAAGAFRPAAVGSGAQRAVRPALRGDRLCWLDPPLAAAEQALLAAFDGVRELLNRELGLGLFDFECQYAIYPPGAGYVRHLDRSPAGAERVVSAVLYLNASWGAGEGGELRLYAEGAPVEVAPQAGTLVLFDSVRLEHEVRPATRERLSVAGWFRRRAGRPT